MSGGTRIAYQPALDGLRALAVAAVLLFHAGVPGFRAGYLGVSVFFTLSGFLITKLLVAEHDATGRIDLAAFYARRVRRLLPASLFTVAVVAVLAATTDLFAGVVSMRRQVVGSVLQVVNWVFLAAEGSYQDRLAGAAGAMSPLEHFWSLAIEEQFYWVWPAAMLGLTAVARSGRGRTIAVGAVTAVSIAAAPFVAVVWGGDAAYWATPARLSEILAGAFLAVVLTGRRVDAGWHAAGLGGLVVLAVLVVRFPGSDRVAEAGVLPIVGVVSALVLLGLQTEGPATRLLSLPPLVWLGRLSYGVYLYHWPIYVIVDEHRLGAGGTRLFVVRIAFTLVAAQLSYVAFEQPIRRIRGMTLPTMVVAVAATVAAVVLGSSAVPATDSDYWRADPDAVEAAAIEVADVPLVATASSVPPSATEPPSVASASLDATDGAAPADGAAPTTPVPPTSIPPIPEMNRPIRVVVTGDSTAEALGAGVIRWAATHDDLARAEVVGVQGCGLLQGGERRHGDGTVSMASCDGWVADFLLPAIDRTSPDVVVVMITSWDVSDRRWDGGVLLHPTDPEYRRRLDLAYGTFVEDAIGRGAGRVAFVRPPIPDPFWLGRDDASDALLRYGVLNDTFDRLVTEQPGTVAIIPLATWYTASGHDDDRDLRPDGVHFTPHAAEQVSDEWLGEQVLRIALDLPR